MKKELALILLIIVLSSCTAKRIIVNNSKPPVSNRSMAPKDSLQSFSVLSKVNQSKMKFKIRLPGNGFVKSDRLLVTLDFQNLTDTSIRIIDLFSEMEVNFSLSISSAKLSERALGPSLSSFPAFYQFKYIEISPGKTYSKTINISEILKKQDVELVPDKYQLSMHYINDKGGNCMIGSFDADFLNLNIVQ